MKQTMQFKKLRSWACLPLFAGLVACGSPGEEGDGDGDGVSCAEGECPSGVEQTPEDARLVCDDSKKGPRTLRRLTRAETQASLEDIFPELGGKWSGVRLSADIASKLGFSNDTATLVVNGSMARELIKTAEDVATIITSSEVLPSVLPCSTSGADAACVKEFVNARGLRLFRRPLSEDEVKRYVDFQQSVQGRSDFETGLKWALVSLIQSPHAMYRSELGEEAGGGYALTQHELATELAYIYTGSTPDPILLRAATDGALGDPAALRAQAERLITEHPRRFDSMRNFFFEWLEYGKVRGQSRADNPDFAQQISPLLIEETRMFLDEIVFAENGDVKRLMTADYTAVNGTLADFYGFGETDDGWVKATRPPGQGLGILAQGSILASGAHQEATSPTLRGLLFYRRFLCNSKPQVPAMIPTIEESTKDQDAKTTREKYEKHHSVGHCGACHKPFEPFGYTMEQFDEMGRYRADEDGHPIDTSATVMLLNQEPLEVTSIEDVAELVHESTDIDNCVSGLMAAYMFSGAGGQSCLAEDSRRALAAGEKSLREFYLDLTAAPHFTTRN